jgi:type IV secretory pathway component VirB8
LRQFNFLLRSNEKNNPFIAYENNIDCKVIINSINEIGQDGIQVRFTVEVLSQDMRRSKFNKIATINFEFINYEVDEETRYINPLGFLITNYRVVDEIF